MQDNLRKAVLGFLAALFGALMAVSSLLRLRKKHSAANADQSGMSDTQTPKHKPSDEAKPASPLPLPREHDPATSQAPALTHQAPPGWVKLPPPKLPEPTYWPVVMSVGIVLLLWGFVSSLLISGTGLLLFILALAGWIGDIRGEVLGDADNE